jgi:hypothetical protein
MFDELHHLLSTQHATVITVQQIPVKAHRPFKNHAEFPNLVDSLIRARTHHLVLEIDFSKSLIKLWLEAFLEYLLQDHVPYPLRDVIAVHLNDGHLTSTSCSSKEMRIDEEISLLLQQEKYLLIAFSDTHLSSENSKFLHQLKALCAHPKCRFILFRSSKRNSSRLKEHANALRFLEQIESEWACHSIAGPNDQENISILKEEAENLEKFHQVVIPEEIIPETYALAKRYLNACCPLEQTLLLLDTSSARAKSYQLGQANLPQMKTILTFKMVLKVLSNWAHIPATHLSSDFKLNDFIEHMKRGLIGQDPAINLLGDGIQQSQSFQTKNEPIQNAYLFAGPLHTGKNTCASLLADFLFQSRHMLYVAQALSPQLTSIIDLKFKREGKPYVSLKALIEECPYAIIIIEEIETASPKLLSSLINLISCNQLEDTDGSLYHFQHAILILTTTLGTKRLIKLNNAFASDSKSDYIDLVELVMSEKKQTSINALPYSPQELVEEIIPEINHHLGRSLCETLHIIPFLPLTFQSIEAIMRSKLNALNHSLLLDHHIHFTYAPEVINYLAKGTIKQGEGENHEWKIDGLLKKLNATILQAIHQQKNSLEEAHHLLLQLNETGTLLRCEWSREKVKRDEKTIS